MSWGARTGLARRTVYASGTAATHTYLPNIKSAIITGVGGGGGSGGVSGSGSNAAAAGGGAGGGYFSVLVTTGLTTCTYTVGTGGSAGTNAPTDGGTGNDTVVVHDSVTYTAKGGGGGKGMVAGTSVLTAAGGVYASAGTGGDIIAFCTPGMPGIRLSGTQCASGAGGNTPLGSGGRSLNNVSSAGYGGCNGGGAGGACSIASAQVGGAGGSGTVVIEEYY
jgi:hypothetical protein